MRFQLLLTFSDKYSLESDLLSITDNYQLSYNRIYILQNRDNADELYITYNIDAKDNPTKQLGNTILVHRKKDYNSLYTINALNELIKENNNGILDKTFSVDWSEYINSIILTNSLGTKIIRTKLYGIKNIN